MLDDCSHRPVAEKYRFGIKIGKISWDSSVGIVMGYGLDDQVLIPGGDKTVSSPQHPDQLCSPPNLLSNGYQGLFAHE
jgi:hypothetical protein